MPIFKTNLDIFKYGSEESHDYKRVSLGKEPVLPYSKKWDYSRELDIDDIELWEVIYEENGQIGVYAAWYPHAEFYMIIHKQDISLYYGKGSYKAVIEKIKELGLPIGLNKVWVDKEDMWLYS